MASRFALKTTTCRAVSAVSRLEYVMTGNALQTTRRSIAAVWVVWQPAAVTIEISASLNAGSFDFRKQVKTGIELPREFLRLTGRNQLAICGVL